AAQGRGATPVRRQLGPDGQVRYRYQPAHPGLDLQSQAGLAADRGRVRNAIAAPSLPKAAGGDLGNGESRRCGFVIRGRGATEKYHEKDGSGENRPYASRCGGSVPEGRREVAPGKAQRNPGNNTHDGIPSPGGATETDDPRGLRRPSGAENACRGRGPRVT